jgi:integrase/recombinase XerC
MLRHTCGTLLYEQTRDIQAVKETLRHKNIEMTSKYSHVQDMALKRYTEAIPIKNKGN